MKKILTITLVLLSFVLSAQRPNGYEPNSNNQYFNASVAIEDTLLLNRLRATDTNLLYSINGVINNLPIEVLDTVFFKDFISNDIKDGQIRGALNHIAEETNLLNIFNVVNGKRIDNSGNIMDDANFFMLEEVPITQGERVATVCQSIGLNFNFVFYSQKPFNSTNFISKIAGREATAPSGAKYVFIYQQNSQRNSTIISKLSSGFPTLNSITLNYNGVYTQDETYTKAQIDARVVEVEEEVDRLAMETNLVKSQGVVVGQRLSNSGDIIPDANAFMTQTPFPVTPGDRFSSVSNTASIFPNFMFYNSTEINSGNFIQRIQGSSVTTPAGATHMVAWTVNSVQSSLIIQKLSNGSQS